MSDGTKLIAVIGDEDTVTGFILAGIGHRTAEGTNFLVVKPSASAFFERIRVRNDVRLTRCSILLQARRSPPLRPASGRSRAATTSPLSSSTSTYALGAREMCDRRFLDVFFFFFCGWAGRRRDPPFAQHVREDYPHGAGDPEQGLALRPFQGLHHEARQPYARRVVSWIAIFLLDVNCRGVAGCLR
ncbi:hypothetical protein ON010_g18995 [Phytophthora cinnamomi]|nr:hypothetical protein ON010_g18995 [Phytophthora cinnamomi]